MSKSKEARKPQQTGRPRGSVTVDKPTATAVPARCPRCQCTAHVHRPGYPPVVMEHDGVSRITGQPYRFVVWTNVVCKGCGQHFRVRSETTHDPRADL